MDELGHGTLQVGVQGICHGELIGGIHGNPVSDQLEGWPLTDQNCLFDF